MDHRASDRRSVTGALSVVVAGWLVACGSGAENAAPVAVITTTNEDGVPLGSVVIVDGSASTDPEGAALAYRWRLLEQPPGGTAEMAEATADEASFSAGLPGVYEVELVVSDGRRDSEPVTITIAVVRLAPLVTLSSPVDNQVFNSNSVAVEGTVDDPDATLTVNGIAVANDAGSFATSLTLSEGATAVVAIATNPAGQGSATVTAVVNTQDNPVVWITSHGSGFIAGPSLDSSPTSSTTTVFVTGYVKVSTLRIGFPDPNAPTVTINGQPVTVVEREGFLGCGFVVGGGVSLDLCYRYVGSVTADLSQELVLTVLAVDVDGREGSIAAAGYVDYCIKGDYDALAHYQADAGGNQNNRCHEIDGCSLYAGENDEITQVFRNDPAQALALVYSGLPQSLNDFSTEFGSGDAPPQEFYIHGNMPARTLPCNVHDQCYQTVGQSQAVCDYYSMYVGTHRVCRSAYPPNCPFTGLESVKCPKWSEEAYACYDAANIYYAGDVQFGASAFEERQAAYTYAGP